MGFAVGDGLSDRGFELESLADAVADFLYEYAVAAQFVAGCQEFAVGGVVDVCASTSLIVLSVPMGAVIVSAYIISYARW